MPKKIFTKKKVAPKAKKQYPMPRTMMAKKAKKTC